MADFVDLLNDGYGLACFSKWCFRYDFDDLFNYEHNRGLCAASIIMMMLFQWERLVAPEVIHFLLSQGANPLLMRGEGGKTIIDLASDMVVRYKDDPEHADSTKENLKLILDDLKLLPDNLSAAAVKFLLKTSKEFRVAKPLLGV
jgi:hypothetical protein